MWAKNRWDHYLSFCWCLFFPFGSALRLLSLLIVCEFPSVPLLTDYLMLLYPAREDEQHSTPPTINVPTIHIQPLWFWILLSFSFISYNPMSLLITLTVSAIPWRPPSLCGWRPVEPLRTSRQCGYIRHDIFPASRPSQRLAQGLQWRHS